MGQTGDTLARIQTNKQTENMAASKQQLRRDLMAVLGSRSSVTWSELGASAISFMLRLWA